MLNCRLSWLLAVLLLCCGCRSHKQVVVSDSTEAIATHSIVSEQRDSTTASSSRDVEIGVITWSIEADSAHTSDGTVLYHPRISASAKEINVQHRVSEETLKQAVDISLDSISYSSNQQSRYEEPPMAYRATKAKLIVLLSLIILCVLCSSYIKFRKNP